MSRYAADTSVPVERSRQEVERVLVRYGATAFGYAWDDAHSAQMVSFRIADRHVRMVLPLPALSDMRLTATGIRRTAVQQRNALDQATRSRWRALVLVVKAKLEAIESGISTVEREFLADMLLPDGSTAYEWLAPQIERAYVLGTMPKRLPGLPAPREDDSVESR